MLSRVKDTIKKFRMLSKGDTIVVGVSGGIDSVALLHMLTGLAEECKLSLIVAHLNHCMRGRESDRDEGFVKEIAKRLGIKCICRKMNISALARKGESLQDVARQARYRFFEEAADRYNADRIATGHTMDDQAETMVMRFLRGAGLSGLSGIPPVRGKYIRPLIDTTREEIERYAAVHGLKFVKDSSNKSTKYLRNKIRLKLMPIFDDYNPNMKIDMARLARILSRDEDYLKNKTKDFYKNLVARRDANTITFSLKKLRNLHDAIKARIFFIAVEELLGASKGFYSCHIEDFLELLSNKLPNISINLPGGMVLYKEYDNVTIERGQGAKGARSQKSGLPLQAVSRGAKSQEKKANISFEQELKTTGKTNVVEGKGLKIAELKAEIINCDSESEIQAPLTLILSHKGRGKGEGVAYFDYDKLKLPIVVRNFKHGDCFIPLGMKGHKKLQDLFIEKKIARRKRSLIPIIISGSEIIWVAGIRQAEYGKVEAKTKKILRIEMQEQTRTG
ncbi:MAG: tRNA lysidine(34) synthetase TilS [Deltaproteobacteria bacterium RIFCSPLOWO2_12_FULL_43_16]|nr:MAG: tRNA lysidine(34) synthetase TilS [Deltaproteobacteria bacterium GWA2_43_19]OGQ09613.1 MAG: tRNA lysidine(34) synthetase TilS [Deltaproteobacteria bacterium RIFCSPHIGHO2_02_FULL_43_33]OGQ60973.1 MAG: tRNA lysidine(34) synthetase TilS [Deltaproteobacteria bacterium RIFCSPLOWO2_12_FULL_43_16]HBR18085.1 tRNA lysidine(34) synthetase TilS [Deltaproteobacteria bacterium]